MTSTEADLLAIVTKALNRPVKLTDTWADLGVDSYGLAQMMTDIESKFNVRFDERVFEIESVAQMVELLDRSRTSK